MSAAVSYRKTDLRQQRRNSTVRDDALLCTTCREWRADDCFHRTPDAPHRRGRTWVCKECRTAKRRRRPLDFRKWSQRDLTLWNRFRIRESDYDAMLRSQGGVCAICGEAETRLNSQGEVAFLCVDHSHETGEIRSLLCHRCNSGIGMFRDDPSVLRKAIAYLEDHA